MKHAIRLFLTALMLAGVGAANALPALQLGDGSGDWSYDSSDQTWVASSSNFTLNAFANATSADGGNGDYAWDFAGSADQTAYLIAAAVPDIGDIDAFDISVLGASLVDSGYGNPPIQDPNSLAGHGVYDTYFEIYEFQFDGPIVDIFNVQPGETGTGKGYEEGFDVTINSLVDGVDGIHFDLFTVAGGQFDVLGDDPDKQLVYAFAPYSHDAGFHRIPEPGVLMLLGLGLAGIALVRRRA